MDVLTHLTAGSCITYLVAGHERKDLSMKETSILIASGAVVAITPDITKYFGDLWGHSLLVAPFIVLPITYFSHLLLKQFRFRTLWLSYFLSVVFGHIFMDFLENDVAPIYPMIKSEVTYGIIYSNEIWIIGPLMLALLGMLFFNRPYKVVASLMAVLVCFLGAKTFYRETLTYRIDAFYADENPKEIILMVGDLSGWPYMIRSHSFFIDGVASFNGITEERRIFLWEDGSRDVLSIFQEGEAKYILCKPAFSDQEPVELEVYVRREAGSWEKIEEALASKIIENYQVTN